MLDLKPEWKTDCDIGHSWLKLHLECKNQWTRWKKMQLGWEDVK